MSVGVVASEGAEGGKRDGTIREVYYPRGSGITDKTPAGSEPDRVVRVGGDPTVRGAGIGAGGSTTVKSTGVPTGETTAKTTTRGAGDDG